MSAAKVWESRFIDDYKISTTSLKALVVHGVVLTSRYAKADEVRKDGYRRRGFSAALAVASIDCGSKVDSYSVKLPHQHLHSAREIGLALDALFYGAAGGHDGIYLDGGPS